MLLTDDQASRGLGSKEFMIGVFMASQYFFMQAVCVNNMVNFNDVWDTSGTTSTFWQ